MYPKMRLECYKAVSVTVSEIVVISKRYLNVFGIDDRTFLKQQYNFVDVDKYNTI